MSSDRSDPDTSPMCKHSNRFFSLAKRTALDPMEQKSDLRRVPEILDLRQPYRASQQMIHPATVRYGSGASGTRARQKHGRPSIFLGCGYVRADQFSDLAK
jgi:hypothetical protein